MPCFCDPGAKLLQYALDNNIPFDFLPGANAASLSACLSGQPQDIKTQNFSDSHFIFGSFLPHKQNNRKSTLVNFKNASAQIGSRVIFYESKHRILDSLKDIAELDPSAHIIALKELTKMHQKRFSGNALSLLDELKNANLNGEWVLIIYFTPKDSKTLNINDINSLNLPPKIKAKLLSKLSDLSTKQIYENMHE